MDFGGAMIHEQRIPAPGAIPPPRAEKVSSGNVKFTLDFGGAMIHGQRIPAPGANSPRRIRKVSSGNVKFTIDFSGAMILGDGEYPRLESSFLESRKYHQEM